MKNVVKSIAIGGIITFSTILIVTVAMFVGKNNVLLAASVVLFPVISGAVYIAVYA